MSDDIEFDGFEDDEEPAKPKQEQKESNAAFAQMRKDLKAAQKDLEELNQLRAYKAERDASDRQSAVSTAFTELGLNPKHAQFFQGEEATPDAVKAWAVENEFLAPTEDAAPAAPAQAGYTPTVISESSQPGSKVYSFDEWLELSNTDAAKANQIWKAGRVADAVRE